MTFVPAAFLHSTAVSTAGKGFSRSSSLLLSTGRQQRRRGLSISTLVASPCIPSTSRTDDNDKNDSYDNTSRRLQQQTRMYHATGRNEIILPFLPEMVAFVVFAGGWAVYRTSQGKTLTPDEALQAQEAYRKLNERQQQQQQQQPNTRQKRQP